MGVAVWMIQNQGPERASYIWGPYVYTMGNNADTETDLEGQLETNGLSDYGSMSAANSQGVGALSLAGWKNRTTLVQQMRPIVGCSATSFSRI